MPDEERSRDLFQVPEPIQETHEEVFDNNKDETDEDCDSEIENVHSDTGRPKKIYNMERAELADPMTVDEIIRRRDKQV
ncbi:hypothetical protein ANTQUA_LOCUS2277 [Anthophora quadrimaculata]